ncbi:class I SAM-dependent methyltransferase [Natrialba sp. INN-245]|uniref:class I SAM-dependent methyltransferase n=1 Tax=Natrialba sp. INN-245 TaxID=2690967 RepID=UPI0013119B40|nr:class I SAM-dependent methyltransferase [Natrialba sp. INN-245]MWV41815.1 methyltransferase domain-containing protein [Natrialba sp. INN-245]
MSVREEFDEWAASGRDRGMEDRHWHTAKYALARMPVEAGDVVLDLGCGSGYAGRALRETKNAGRIYGLDGSPEMTRNAAGYTDYSSVGYVVGDFGSLPFATDSIDHVWSMEAFYYAADPHHTLEEIARVLRPGGTVYCAVDYYEENVHSHEWQESISVEMTRWDRAQYREAFREAGLHVAEQDNLPNHEIEIPPESEFPTDNWDTRQAMLERYREFGTLLTVGVAP